MSMTGSQLIEEEAISGKNAAAASTVVRGYLGHSGKRVSNCNIVFLV